MSRSRLLVTALAAFFAAALSPCAQAAAPAALQAPVLTQPVGTGDIIAADQLTTRELAGIRAGGQIFTDARRIIGKQARRPLSANQPIRLTDLKEPDLIRKGQAVTLVFAQDGLIISTLGKALQDGAAGDLVRIENPVSKQLLYGQVSAPGEVTVSAGVVRTASVQ